MYFRLLFIDFAFEIPAQSLALVLQLVFLAPVLSPHFINFLRVLFHLLYITTFLHFSVFSGTFGTYFWFYAPIQYKQ